MRIYSPSSHPWPNQRQRGCPRAVLSPLLQKGLLTKVELKGHCSDDNSSASAKLNDDDYFLWTHLQMVPLSETPLLLIIAIVYSNHYLRSLVSHLVMSPHHRTRINCPPSITLSSPSLMSSSHSALAAITVINAFVLWISLRHHQPHRMFLDGVCLHPPTASGIAALFMPHAC